MVKRGEKKSKCWKEKFLYNGGTEGARKNQNKIFGKSKWWRKEKKKSRMQKRDKEKLIRDIGTNNICSNKRYKKRRGKI